MSKLFWGLVMLFSLMITAWSGFFVYNELQPKEPTAVPLTPVEPAPVEAVVPVEISSATAVTTTAEPVKPEETAAPIKPAKTKSANPREKQQIVFRYIQSSAKKVSVIGDFNKWFRQPMKRDGDEWKVEVKLVPGKYTYVFVVNDAQTGASGKRVLDPANKQTTQDGKLSVLMVKPSDQ